MTKSEIVKIEKDKCQNLSDIIEAEVFEIKDKKDKTSSELEKWFPLTANKLADIMMNHGNSYIRQCFGYFYPQKLIQDCNRLIPCPIERNDVYGLLRMIQTYNCSLATFQSIDGNLLYEIYNQANVKYKE